MRKVDTKKLLWIIIPSLMFALTIVVLPFIDLRGARKKIALEMSSGFRGEVEISHAYLSLFPWPHITLKRARIYYPQRGELISRRIEVYPHILPLLKRKIVLKRLVFKSPVLDIILPKGAREKESWFLSLFEGEKVSAIPSIEAEGGVVNILQPGEQKPFFSLQNAQGYMSPRNDGRLQCNLRFSCPAAAMVEITAPASEGGARGNGYSFMIRGTRVKVDDARGIALALMGENETVREIFKILLGGELPRISFYGEGKDLKDALDVKRNLLIRGTIFDGIILAPTGPLPLEGVTGDFEIAREVLRGRNIKARLSESVAQKGMIIVGLSSERDEFYLDSDVEATAADIVTYLPLVLTERRLQREIRRFKNPNGWVKGRLTLGGNINEICPTIESRGFDLSFRHDLFSWPISMRGDTLSFKNGILTWESTQESLGKSSLANGKARVTLVGKRPSLSLSYQRGSLALEQIGEWIKAPVGLERMRFITGTLDLSDFKLTAIFNPFQAEDIYFHVKRGNVTIHPSFSPIPLLARGVEVRCNKGGRLVKSKDGPIKALGEVAWKTDTITWGSYRWKDVKGLIAFTEGGTGITVTSGDLCGITSQGMISYGHEVTFLDLRFKATEVELSPTVSCLWGEDVRLEGIYSLDGHLKAEGKEDSIRENSQGSLLFHSYKGRIYHWTLLTRLFSLLNVIGIMSGELPDLKQKGFPYNKFIIKGEVKNGYLHLKETVIDGQGMKIVGTGKIDIFTGETDLVVLMAPLKTMDVIMHNIPIFGRILTGKSGTFLSVPFSITGPIHDPKIIPLSPTAVGAGLWGVLKRTLETPIEIIKPVLPKEKPDKNPSKDGN